MNMTTRQQEEVDSNLIRKILKTTPVDIGRSPLWLDFRMLSAAKEGLLKGWEEWANDPDGSGMVWYCVMDTLGGHQSWIDHWGTTLDQGREWFVSEPYNFYDDTAKQVQAFADLLCLDWYLSPNSWHFPGHTLRLQFYPTGQCRWAASTYAIQSGDFIKIGKSKDIASRQKDLQVGNPLPLTLVGMSSLPEKEVHHRLKCSRVGGEWFRITDEVRWFLSTHFIMLKPLDIAT